MESEFVAMKDVGALGGARASILPESLGHAGPEAEWSLGSDVQRPLGDEALEFGGTLRV